MYSGRNYRDSLVNKETLVSCSQEPHDFNHVRFRSTNGVLSPEEITITATLVGGATMDSWYIDGIKNTLFVGADNLSITIPSSYMQDKQLVLIKATTIDGSFDTISVAKVTDAQESITVLVNSSNGVIFRESSSVTNTLLICRVYRGTKSITPKSYKWYRNGVELPYVSGTITVDIPDVSEVDNYYCIIDV